MTNHRGPRFAMLATLTVTALTMALPASAVVEDRLVGGGSIDNPDLHVTIGGDLPCTAGHPGANLQINWFNPQPDPPGRESFHMSVMTTAECTIDEPDLRNGGGTHEGSGLGECRAGNDVQPARIEWTLSDGGIDNPDLRDPDRVRIEIVSTAPGCNLSVTGNLRGNLRFVDNPDFAPTHEDEI